MLKKLLTMVGLGAALFIPQVTIAWDLSSQNSTMSEALQLSAKAQNLKPQVVEAALTAYQKARQLGLDSQQILTIVDYSIESTSKRLWVFDMKTHNLLFQELVAHGKNSGDNIPTSFSNDPQSLKSSLGVFVTQSTYVGHDGYSLRLNGLEKGFNDKALSRDIIFHPAPYVSDQFAATHSRLGRSWGCFALDPKLSKPTIDTIKGGSVVFAYYPDQNWLNHSNFLKQV